MIRKYVQIITVSLLAMLSISASAAENYFRPGTVWTIEAASGIPEIPHTISYNTILDEVSFDGEQVLPFVEYSEREQANKLLCYLRVDGDKIFWRSTNPEYADWHLLYDFGLQVDEEATVYDLFRPGTSDEKFSPVKVRCIKRDYFMNDNPLKNPLMSLELLERDGEDHSSDRTEGSWIIGMGCRQSFEGILTPGYFGFEGGTSFVVCVESPKGNIVYGEPPVAEIRTVTEDFDQPVNSGVYNLQGIRVNESKENLPAGIYIVEGKKFAIGK